MNDRATIRLVTALLGAVTLFITALSGWLADHGKALPPELLSMGAGALGALSALLASTRSHDTPTAPDQARISTEPPATGSTATSQPPATTEDPRG